MQSMTFERFEPAELVRHIPPSVMNELLVVLMLFPLLPAGLDRTFLEDLCCLRRSDFLWLWSYELSSHSLPGSGSRTVGFQAR